MKVGLSKQQVLIIA